MVKITTNKIFPIHVSSIENLGLITTKQDTSTLWHLSYEHISLKVLNLLSKKGIVSRLPLIDHLEVCEAYIYGKQHKRSFSTSAVWRASTPLVLIHIDVCGPMQTTSIGSKYYLLITDDYT